MNDIANYPLAPFVSALRTVTGRVVLVCAAVVIGSALGGMTAMDQMGGAWEALGSFFEWAAVSFFFGVGMIAFPAAFLFTLLFIRYEWPLWTVVTVVLLLWWNSHKTLHYIFHESASAKIQKQLDEFNRRQNQQQKKSASDGAGID